MRDPMYAVWYGMIGRCHRPARKDYARYGGRGIKVCDRWFNSFEAFTEDMGERPEGMSVERIDNDKGYSPDNCKWATPKEQANNRHDNNYVKYKGKYITVSGLAEQFNIHPATLWQRIFRYKYSPEEAVKKDVRNIRPTIIKYKGKTQDLKLWAKDTGIKYGTLYYRIYIVRWPIKKALSEPLSIKVQK